MTEEIDVVMFDLGGTLIDLSPSKDVVFHKVLTEHGFSVPLGEVSKAIAEAERRFDEESTFLDGVHEDSFWDRFDKFVVDRLGCEVDYERFAEAVSAEFCGIVPRLESWIEYPDSRPLLERLKKREFRLGIISNATKLAREVIDNLDLTKYFDTIIISDEVGVRKPDERIFLLAAKHAKASPNRVLFIGDKLAVDIVGAKRAGMNAILVDRAGVYSDVDCVRVRSLDGLRTYL